MKSCIAFCLFAFVAVALGRPEESKYTDKYDKVNVNEVLGNDRLLEAFYNCVMDIGKCTSEGKELKSHISDALETYCSKCTDIQKTETRHVIGFLINEKPAYWEALTAKYDPTKKYVTKYETELKKVKA